MVQVLRGQFDRISDEIDVWDRFCMRMLVGTEILSPERGLHLVPPCVFLPNACIVFATQLTLPFSQPSFFLEYKCNYQSKYFRFTCIY